MRVAVERNGSKEVVEVAPDLSTASLGGRTFPVRILTSTPTRIEVEVAGERVVLDQWPEHFASPPGPVDLNGERWRVAVEVEALAASPATNRAATRALSPAASSDGAPSVAPPEGGVAVVPPMPGRVIEVRVREGDHVEKGAVLLVLEAMKMRNEIPSPVAGTVGSVRIEPGTNARAREPMLYILPAASR